MKTREAAHGDAPTLPDAVGVGVARSATTYISEVLSAHPEVRFSWPKETYFFSTDQYELG